MKQPNLSKWQYSRALEGLLFFAQVLDELLFHYTLDSFKAPALNAHASAWELATLAEDYRSGRILPGTIPYVLEELEYNLNHDPALRFKESSSLQALLADLKSHSGSPVQLACIADSLLSEMGRLYWTKLRLQIIEAVKSPMNKIQINSLATSLAVEIELRGFSRSYVYSEVERFFFDPNSVPSAIATTDQIEEFLKILEVEDREWQAIYRASKDFLKFKDYAEKYNIIIYDSNPPDIDNMIIRMPREDIAKFPCFIVQNEISEKDTHKAREYSESNLEYFADVCRFHDHECSLFWFDQCAIKDVEKKSTIYPKSPPNPMNRTPRKQTYGVFENVDRIGQTIEILAGQHMVEESTNVFRKALDYHQAAMDAKTPENQLVDLWAALEGFVPPPSDKERNRIEHYLNTLLPTLTLTYPEKIFRYVANSIYYSEPSIKEFINSLKCGDNYFEKTVSLLVCADLNDERSQFFSLLNSHPHLRYRCHRCLAQYGSAKRIRKTIHQHRTRISWQIQRIYTARNQIVHSAQAPIYLATLVENLHSYIDRIMISISHIGINTDVRLTMESALTLLAIHCRTYLNDLEGMKEACITSNFKELIFGRDNPLSPFAAN